MTKVKLTRSPPDLAEPARMRRLAEQKAVLAAQSNPNAPTAETSSALLYELQVHQFELEMQNEELRRVQEELEHSRARYFHLFEMAPVGYLTLSDKGLIMEANLTMAALLEVPRKFLIGRPLTGFILREDQYVYFSLRDELFRSGRPQACDLRLLKKDQGLLWVRLEAVMDPAAEDGAGWRAVISDITGRKEAEGELQKSRDELEQRVKARTVELSSTVDRLKQLNRELQEFTSIASHDLQEPIRKIETFGELVNERSASRLDPTSQDHLERLLRSAHRMRQLLSDLLILSRVTTKAQPFKEIDMGKTIREAIEILELRVKETGAELMIEPVPVIEGDETQLRQLFQNLIANALKFRGTAAPKIRIFSRKTDQDTCEIVVRDNGIGFDMEFAEDIFKPFERLHGSSTYEGTGMGLAICRKIVERHGGAIRAESEPGRGASFIVRLSLRQFGAERK
jgi:two-component system, chemotaxis family, sensor kinase Cph1